ncbi:MAG: protease inhibitor I42 family protein [Bacteroidota bacterium]
MPEKKQLTEKDSGASIDLRVQDILVISLLDNPTTGFQWEIDRADSQILRPIGNPVYEPSSNLVGSAGRTTFQFEAAEAGSTKLRLLYYRPFEKDVAPASTFDLNVTITGR